MKDIKGFEGLYAITKDGKVWSYPRLGSSKKGKWLKWGNHRKGYHVYKLNHYNQPGKTFFAHRLVALTYIPNPNNLPEVNHRDGVKTNNSVHNLEGTTHVDNIRHAYKNNLVTILCGEKHPMAKLSDIGVKSIRKMYIYDGLTQRQIAKLFGVTQSAIWRIVNHKSWV